MRVTIRAVGSFALAGALACAVAGVVIWAPAGDGIASAAEKAWGTDINAGAGPELIESVRADLAGIVAAPESERAALIDAFVAARGPATVEAVKRFRNPELLDLHRALLRHDDWHVQHRALLALEHLADEASIPAAWALLTHEAARMRERAALFLIAVWDAGAAGKAAGGDPAKAVSKALAGEGDPHVAACLDALLRTARGKLPVVRAHTEHVVALDDGLLLTPFISGMHETKQKAPDYTAKGVSLGGGGSAAKLAADRPWTTPLLGLGTEEVQGTSLQPFANLRQNGAVYHTGLDVGACMDGAGYYAAADGIVRMVHSGSDMGTLLVVQHPVGDKRTVNAVYMHGGSRVFVKGGEEVVSGQLLGTMGMSYSIENGGHYAHLHYGLYPGDFSQTHNYGYRGVPSGLVDWHDPAHYLPVWAELNRPVVVATPGGAAELAKVRAKLAAGRAGDAHALLAKALAVNDLPRHARAEAEGLTAAIEAAVAGVPARAARLLELGYPGHAARFVETAAKALKGAPGAESIKPWGKTWAGDVDLKAALKTEARIRATEERALGLAGQKGGAAQARALYDSLLEELAGSPFVGRLEALSRGTGTR